MKKNYFVDKYELDNNQMSLLTNDENSLVIAGAGSGKTLTILGKVNYLIEQKQCLPENIIIISFTNASVNDIKSRIKHPVNVFTFHKLAIHILNIYKFQYKLCSTNKLTYIIEESLKTCNKYEQKIILQYLKLNITYQKFLKSKHFKSFCNLAETFINLFKSSNSSEEKLLKKNYTLLEKKLIIIILNIYIKYNLEKQSVNELDFDDLIIYATNIVEKLSLNYKYIIIDEFQDTSLIRLNLIKEIFKNTKSKIIVVGDDWQSIYRFSGCDLNIFLNFSKTFPNVNNINLSNTYRNSSELITIASEFIQKNPLQIQKKLRSLKSSTSPLIFVPYVDKKIVLKNLLNELAKKSQDIMILTRNNKDIFDYIDKDYEIDNNYLYLKNHKFKYYTVHRSKGLEAKHVIVLNCDNTSLGFPNKIENSPIIDKLICDKEIKFAEERRLFYVAITRCKENTYLIYNKKNPSIFIKEIKRITKKHLHKITYFK